MVLINLAAAELLEAVRGLPEALLVPPEVVEETAGAGERLGYADALAIRKALTVGTVRLARDAGTRVVRRLQREARLRRTDAAVVALAMKHRAIVGSDDAKVRRVAELQGMTCGGTGYLLARLIATGTLTREDARSRLDSLVAGGWYCDVRTYAEILRQLGF
jgi:predicted nucleic acid-binding protein